MKILFIVPYPPGEAPSQRFRFEQYFDILSQHGYTYAVKSFFNLSDWQILYSPGRSILKTIKFILAYIRRYFLLFTVPAYDFIFIHREAAPVGPPVLEWIIANIMRKKIIYDFDDAIWLTDKKKESFFEKSIRWRNKVSLICKWSYKVSCGNHYLCAYAKQFNTNVVYNPTTIDTENLHNPGSVRVTEKSTITVGWTGSHTTLKYLKEVESALIALENKYSHVNVLVIANKKPELAVRSLRFLPWRKETEAEDLSQIDIGIMPLPNDEWTNGKCGFKALQYMAMNVPSIVSPVGVNKTIIEQGVTGLYASTPEEWLTSLEKLIMDASLRKRIGEAGRQKIIDQYSVSSNASVFLSLFSK